MKGKKGREIVSPVDTLPSVPNDFFTGSADRAKLNMSFGIDAYIAAPQLKAFRLANAYAVLRGAMQKMTDEEKHALFEILGTKPGR